MFKLATCNDLIRLRNKYSALLYPEEHSWGLKQFGTLFCHEQLAALSPKVVLEAGAGRNRFFDQNLPLSIDYWMLDCPGFYDPVPFNNSLAARKRTRFIPGLLGEFSEDLPSAQFDAIFSISVLEHVPPHGFHDCSRDMFRLLRPGGTLLHTIDLNTQQCTERSHSIFESFRTAGFDFDGDCSVSWDYSNDEPILIEPLPLVYRYYYKGDPAIWHAGKPLFHTGSITVVAKKPL